jgi:hypothetical protein
MQAAPEPVALLDPNSNGIVTIGTETVNATPANFERKIGTLAWFGIRTAMLLQPSYGVSQKNEASACGKSFQQMEDASLTYVKAQEISPDDAGLPLSSSELSPIATRAQQSGCGFVVVIRKYTISG